MAGRPMSVEFLDHMSSERSPGPSLSAFNSLFGVLSVRYRPDHVLGPELKRKYLWLLKVATVHADGCRLVLKNPVNTARVRLLLEMFPDAKFVHVFRSPYDVFASTQHLHSSLLPITTVQTLDEPGVRNEGILALYEEMMRCYFADRSLIPAGNLAEVRFEDLERDPVGELARVYDNLDLPGFAQARPAIEGYVAQQRGYVKNALALSQADRERVEQRWGFALDELGYRRSERAQGQPAGEDGPVMA